MIPNAKADQQYVKTIEDKLGDSSSNIDQAIADYHKERSLTTSAITGAFNTMKLIADKIPTMKQEDVDKSLDTMNKYLDFLKRNSNYTGQHLDAAALKTFNFEDTIRKLYDSGKIME